MHVLGHVSLDMTIILYINCMYLTIYWFLLSSVFIYICLCLYIYVLYDYELHDYLFYTWCMLGYYVCLRYWHIDILILSIDSLAYLSILTLFVVWLSYSSWHMYSRCRISSSSWYVDSLFYILSWLSLRMLFISLILFLA